MKFKEDIISQFEIGVIVMLLLFLLKTFKLCTLFEQESPLRNTMADERISYLVVFHIHKHKDVNVDNVVIKCVATNSINNNNNIFFLIINNFIFTIKRPIYIYLQKLKYFHQVRTKISPTDKNNNI